MIQLRISATDSAGVQACEVSKILTIVVRRNEFAPEWDRADRTYTTTILETHSVLSPVIRVAADDDDVSVSGVYSIFSISEK